MTLLDYALRYRRRGWQLVPIPAGQKAPRIREWQMMRLTEAEAVKCFNGAGNIGIILGQASGGLVDIDLDCPEAIQFAQSLLPTTQSIFGRISKPQSHRLYRVSGPAPSLQFKDPIKGDTLLELRGDGGRQTVFPPSNHPSGESIDWSSDDDPQQVGYVALTKQVKLLAARCLIARYLPGVTNGTELWRALSDVDERAAERIQDWIAMPTAPAVSPNALVTIGGQLSQQIPDYLAGLPRTRRVHQVLHSFARNDLNDAVRELSNKKKPGRGNSLHRKSIK